MSMSEEGKNPSARPAVSGAPEQDPSGQHGAEQQETGLPGLAGFGGMSGYAPVTGQQQATQDATEPEPEIPAFLEQEHLAGALEQEQYPHGENTEPQYTDAGPPETGAEASYVSADAPSVQEDAPYVQENAPYVQGEAPYAQEEAPYAQGEAPYAQEEAPYAQEEAPYVQEEAPYVQENAPYAQEEVQEYISEQDPVHGVQQDTAQYDDTGLYGGGELPGDAGTSLQTFEAHYDQHPEIPLDAFEDPGQEQAAQPFFHESGQVGDAEFMGGESSPDAAAPKERRGRRILMAASGLIGVLALGGALAFAYKIGGDSDIASAGKPPLIQADSRPVKSAPDKPGGKQFPHKNKKIYERLQGSNSNEVERLVSRQEDVAVATTAAINAANPEPATGAQTTGEPRKVRTLTVRPDGTMELIAPRQKLIKAPAPPAAAPKPTSDGGTGIALSFPQATATASTPPAAAPVSAAQAPVAPNIPKPVEVTPPPAAPQKLAAKPPVKKQPVPPAAAPAPAPAAAPAPAPRKTASLPASSPAASSSEYVVQVASRKSQTGALAAFADIQQKYPSLLSGYRPIIKRADLGSKGVWYRLNVGPIKNKKVASSLCGKLKSAGMRSCIVHAQ